MISLEINFLKDKTPQIINPKSQILNFKLKTL